ncbi:hypothetical protein CL176_04340 [Suicoccus acidiformans]|uniref:MotA/TolQ/ExbB proton channel domain-containing protein n=1 Tax=Suicoccus acidiformans TaxID=2036206 RepID=A0A347WJM9_9LACT|nr:MotA/TolQ/ExbB proton channel family protein [Suicoccus acidiformans]AXY25286.1 hypothetical protein CL176_04340 [Suicoccus acidiformans]
MALLRPIAENFFKFDFLIIILAIATGFLYWACLKSCQDLRRILLPKGNLALGNKTKDQLIGHFEFYLDPAGEQAILDRRQKMNSLYVLFLNVCAIFPLMGLLGTVISLIPMVEAMQTALFFDALTSTFWGIVFAILFKGLNGFLQAQVEENIDLVNTYLVRMDAMEARHAVQEELVNLDE